MLMIPLDQLQPETLRRVVEEYVTRDGTDLVDMADKVDQGLAALHRGRAEMYFDEKSQTTTIVFKDR